jgi:hypothetical protein
LKSLNADGSSGAVLARQIIRALHLDQARGGAFESALQRSPECPYRLKEPAWFHANGLDRHQAGGSVTIFYSAEKWCGGAQKVGTGVGPNPIMNQLMGPVIFAALGYDAAQSMLGLGP